MFLLLSFVVALLSLYYLGVMADTPNADTTYLTPTLALLIYSVTCIFKEVGGKAFSWLIGDDIYDTYNSPTGRNYEYDYYGGEDWYNGNHHKKNEKVEYFTPNKKEKKIDDVKEIIHYPSRGEVRDKIKELEKSRWFRFKRSVADFVGIDITEKYYQPTKTYVKKVKPINKEDNTRFMPNNSRWAKKELEEIKEFNSVVKYVGRCCEIAINDEVEQTTESEGNE